MPPAPIAPLNYFLHADGPAARPTLMLDWVLTGISVTVCVIIAGLLLAAIFRRRPPADAFIVGQEGGGIKGVYIGTALSTFILFALVIYSLVTLAAVADPPKKPALTVTVTGYDWWWKVEYDNPDPALRVVTANEIHIPVGVPVAITLKSADVIHSFWVPRLAGKTQMIPGLANRQWIEADAPGIYRGQCNQFCGVQHAHMAFEVIAQTKADYDAWLAAERRLPPDPRTEAEQTGARIFSANCAACHAVKGAGARGEHAPDLSHLGARREIAAGMLSNTPEHRMEWIAHVQDIKPGARMPDFAFSPADANALSAYLSTLQ